MPLVKIKPGVTHRGHDGELLKAGEEFDASPAEMESFGDKFILVVDELENEPPGATRGALKLAAEHSISLALSDITGTGVGGRITKADVEAFLNGNAE